MRRALSLARRGRGWVAPNPMVGAVVVRDGRVVGEGWHAGPGRPHAEIEALSGAREAARGATVYVSLEPCDHHGRTPPCTRALVEAGVGRVAIGCGDPHPEASGGAAALRAAGVEVAIGVEGRAAARLNAPFLWRHGGDGIFVELKLALSLDGRIARRVGESTPVTGEEVRRCVHRLRATHDAVLVGAGTVRVDDPLLTVREGWPPRRPPVRVVLDGRLGLAPDRRLVASAGEAPVWILCGPTPEPARRRALEAAGARVLLLESGALLPGGRLAPRAALRRLEEEGLGSVLVEGGGRVAASFLQRGAIQRMRLFYAPVVFGAEGVAAFAGDPGSVGEGVGGGWKVASRRSVGPDTEVVLESEALAALLEECARGEERGAGGRADAAGGAARNAGGDAARKGGRRERARAAAARATGEGREG